MQISRRGVFRLGGAAAAAGVVAASPAIVALPTPVPAALDGVQWALTYRHDKMCWQLFASKAIDGHEYMWADLIRLDNSEWLATKEIGDPDESGELWAALPLQYRRNMEAAFRRAERSAT